MSEVRSKGRKRVKSSDKFQEEPLDKAYLAEMMSSSIQDQQKLKRNKKALEALFLVSSGKYPLRAILSCECGDTALFLVDCISRRLAADCSLVSALSIRSVPDVVRSAARVSLKVVTEVFEGEVSEIRPIKDKNEQLVELEVTLRTSKASKSIKIGPGLIPAFEVITIGDVVYIDPSANLVQRLGRGEGQVNEHDLECDRYIQLSKGPVNAIRTYESTVSIASVDNIFKRENEALDDGVREHVDSCIREYFESGNMKPADSQLIIRNAELLTLDQLVQLNYWADLYPWVGIILVGAPQLDQKSEILSQYLWIEVAEGEDKMDLLVNSEEKLKDAQYTAAVKEYLDKFSFTLLSSVIKACDNVKNFREMMEVFSKE